jgi:quinol-cytochrome oxidoreductase complex cytochrome b subunit
MKFPWFRRYGLFCLPVTMMGWIVVATFMAAAILLFLDIDSRSHSASDTLRPFIIDLFLLFIVYSFIGFLTSREK